MSDLASQGDANSTDPGPTAPGPTDPNQPGDPDPPIDPTLPVIPVVPGQPIAQMYLTNVNTQNHTRFRLFGEVAGDSAGQVLSKIGDFNNDGFSDFAIGSSQSSPLAKMKAGSVYVVYGNATKPSADIPLVNLNSLNKGFRLVGNAIGNTIGGSLAPVADFNGDGLPDLLIGAPEKSLFTGEAYILFGHTSSLNSLNDFSPANFNPASASFPTNGGVKLQPTSALYQKFGGGLGSADLNGDGLSDLLIGSGDLDTNGSTAGVGHGRSTLLFGKASALANVNLAAGLPANQGLTLDSATANTHFGQRIVSAGDLDGDNREDAIFASPGDNSVYLVFGSSGISSVADINSLLASNAAVKISGPANTNFGIAVASAGHMNGDSKSDIIILASTANPYNSGSYSGAVYVIFGDTRANLKNLDIANLSGNNGFVVHGGTFTAAGALANFIKFAGPTSVAGLGDINKDNHDDIAITMPSVLVGDHSYGETYFIYGRASGFADLNGANLYTALDGVNGFKITGDNLNSASSVVSPAGDINGDGYADTLLATPNGGPINAGVIHVLYGSDFTQ